MQGNASTFLQVPVDRAILLHAYLRFNPWYLHTALDRPMSLVVEQCFLNLWLLKCPQNPEV